MTNISSFTIILVQDLKDKGFTAICTEYPDLVAKGENKYQAMANLLDLYYDDLKKKEKNY